MSGCGVVFVLVGSALVESLVGSGIGGEDEGGGFPDDAGGLAIDCWLQQAYQVSNWSTGLLMRRRVSLALHVRLFNNRSGACAGACVYVCVYVVLMEMMLVLLSLDNDSICCAAFLVAPTLTATNVNRAEPRYLFSSQHRHQAVQPEPASASSLKHAFPLSLRCRNLPHQHQIDRGVMSTKPQYRRIFTLSPSQTRTSGMLIVVPGRHLPSATLFRRALGHALIVQASPA